MRPLFVVLHHPLCLSPDLIQRLEYIGIERFVSIGPIQPFDEGILIRLVQLNVLERDPAVYAPGGRAVGEESQAVVEVNRLRLNSKGWSVDSPIIYLVLGM